MAISILFFFFFNIDLFIWLHWVLVEAYGIYFLDQGWNPGPLHWEGGVLVTGPPLKSPYFILIMYVYLGLPVICVGGGRRDLSPQLLHL